MREKEIVAPGKTPNPWRQGYRDLVKLGADALKLVAEAKSLDRERTRVLANIMSDWLAQTASDPEVFYMVAQRVGDAEEMKRFDRWDDLIDHLVEVLGMEPESYERPEEWDGDDWDMFLDDMKPYRENGACSTLIISRYVVDRFELKQIG